MLAGPHQSHSPSLLSTTLLRSTTLFSRNTMIFASFALLSGMVLSATAAPGYYPPAPGYSPPAPVTHWVDVSNDNAELFYNPPYIVSQQSRHYISTLVLTHLSFRAPMLETRSHSSSIPRTTLSPNPALKNHALLFMAEPTPACASHLSRHACFLICLGTA